MWRALQTRKHHRAILGTLGRVLLLPWLAVFFFVFLTIGGGVNNEATAMVMIAFWFALGAMIAFGFGTRAKAGLREELRGQGRGGAGGLL